jgi:alpha,alpha-trehalase
MNDQKIFNQHPLFADVQLQQIFPDGKTFVDCVPKEYPETINQKYLSLKDKQGFNLEAFIHEYFQMPVVRTSGYVTDEKQSVEQHIEELWEVLSRNPVTEEGTLVPLPYPYIVPGGRFGEIYYWDSYFTMLGLKASGKEKMLENMVNNFSYLIDTIGYIPNGSRSYYSGRSQPPFYSLMVKLLMDIKGKEVLPQYLPYLEKEYQFWMKDADKLNEVTSALRHVVLMPGGEILNRYWDENNTPRPEAYRQDIELAKDSEREAPIVYRNLRAGAESGWDFSSRWFKQPQTFSSIHTTDIVPVDLNCLLWYLENLLSKAYELKRDRETALRYKSLKDAREKAIQLYCWSTENQFYFDYDIDAHKHSEHFTLAAAFPLFFGLAQQPQARSVAVVLRERFLRNGGVLTTLRTTGQQWDAPNGWAPLQWVTIIGLENYGYHELARLVAQRWIKLNIDVFERTGKLMEKYNVVDTNLEAGGGEYPGQDGFGWTNGVLAGLMKKYGKPE